MTVSLWLGLLLLAALVLSTVSSLVFARRLAVLQRLRARLEEDLQARNRDVTQALERETATAEILRVISSYPTTVEPVFETILDHGLRLCGAHLGFLFLCDGDGFRLVADRGAPDAFVEARRGSVRMGPQTGLARAVAERRPIQIEDVRAERAYAERDPARVETVEVLGARTCVWVPMLREGKPVGAVAIWRREVRAFTAAQIALLATFASQAVIAIENVRLFQELQARNRDLTEALARQTATAEVLRVISRSQTDLQPVFGAILESAARLCVVDIGSIFRIEDDRLVPVATTPNTPESWAVIRQHYPRPVDTTSLLGRAAAEGKVIHMPDAEDTTGPPRLTEVGRGLGIRSQLSVPMLRGGEPIGVIGLARRAPGPFSDTQIGLIKTFADQAVIAIENARLLGELQARTRELARSVEELRALGEVGRTVSSTLDLQTVLATIVSRAVQLSGTSGGVIYEYDETSQEFHLRASHRMEEELVAVLREAPIRRGEGATGQSVVRREPVQVANIIEDPEHGAVRVRTILARLGYRSVLAVPLLLEERIMGALTVWRREAGSFPPEAVNLLQTFATQSVLAIQNARLFREIEEKGRQLEVASRHKSQFLANMSHELRTPLNAILGYSELILDNIHGEVPGKIREVMERVDKSGRHLLGLINDVLDLSKIEAGQLTLSVTDYSMTEVVQSVFTAVESLAAEKQLALKVSVPPALPLGKGDERRLTQVVLNLVGNAIKFTEAGEVC
ncbi:MAG: GAF domain-containing protein, partial [Candidatus Rokuibacteriota bacterium]